MSMQEQARVSVRIMEKEYVIACPYEERTALLDTAEFLNNRMREIRDSGKVVGLDRIAVMVALNLANELLRLKNHTGVSDARLEKLENDASGRVRALRERVEGAIEKGQQLEL
ncbi:MAG TPA: cell division protein ZapA [Steroidobacteraceae bacterium]